MSNPHKFGAKKFEHTIKGDLATIKIKTNNKNLILMIQDCYDKGVIDINKQLEGKSEDNKKIPFNCRICKYCIEDYDTGELICNFDEENTDLLRLGECSEFKIGKIRLVELLEEMENKIKALKEKVGIMEVTPNVSGDFVKRLGNKVAFLESALLKIFNAFSRKYADGWSEDTLYNKLIEIEYDLKKQLEASEK